MLLAGGLWPSFLTRPFGRIPDPDGNAEAIFVTAIDTFPLAPNPMVAIGLHASAFSRGLDVLGRLTDGLVFVCHAPGAAPARAAHERLRYVTFSGRHPAGLPSTHIHALAPVHRGRIVWHIGYQDVIAIGHLASTGMPWTDRYIALSGPGVRDPALVRVTPGASLDELLSGEMAPVPVRVLSGSVLAGREAGYLGRYDNQVTVLTENAAVAARGVPKPWLYLAGGARAGAIVPREVFERVMPLNILPVPLMRALSVGDISMAESLGCLELIEEDMALLSYLCTTGTDYGALLRHVLDDLAGSR